MTVGICWLCGEEASLWTSWKIDDGWHDVCGECDWKIDQILKHYGSNSEFTTNSEKEEE